MRSPDFRPELPDTMLLAVWNGEEIAWPSCDGEAYSVIRAADGSIIEEEELSGRAALSLDWEPYELTHHMVAIERGAV
jgi:hypothetical protein